MKGTCRTTQWGDRATHLVWSIFHGISCTCEWSFWHVAMRQLFSTIILTPLLSPTEFTMGISYTCESGSRDLINGFCSPRHGSSYTIHSTWVVNWGTFWIRKAWGRYPLQNHDKFLGDLCAQFSVALTYVDSTKGTGCNIIQFIILLLWFYCFMSKGRGFCSFARLNKCLYHLPWNPFPLLPSPFLFVFIMGWPWNGISNDLIMFVLSRCCWVFSQGETSWLKETIEISLVITWVKIIVIFRI